MAKVADANTVVDELVRHIEQNLPEYNGMTVAEIIKAGSLGHGTAVPGCFDLDLVIYSTSVTPEDVRDNGYKKWLDQLHIFLKHTLHSKYCYQDTTLKSVQFVYNGIIEVDLLISPNWQSPDQLYSFLETVRPRDRNMFSLCASKWQVEFFKKQPPEVKEYIKRAKAWRNKMWPKDGEGTGKPSSYLISLIVQRAYRRCPTGRRNRDRLPARVTREFMAIVNHERLNICWENKKRALYYYRRRDYPTLLPSRPRIIDPANPSNNVYVTGIWRYGSWELFRKYVHTLDLSRPVE